MRTERRRWALIVLTAVSATAVGGGVAAFLPGGAMPALAGTTPPVCTFSQCPGGGGSGGGGTTGGTVYTPPVTTHHRVDRPPAPVAHLAVKRSAKSGAVLLTWTNPPARDLAEIVVWRSKPPHCPAGQGTTSRVGGTAIRKAQADPKASPGTTYCYAVFAVDRAGNYSTPMTVTAKRDTNPPVSPTVTATTVAGGTRVSWSWPNGAPADLAGVVVRRGVGTACPTKHTDGTLIPRSGGGVALDAHPSAGVDQCYAVFAFDAARNYSRPADGHNTAPAPSTPPVKHPGGGGGATATSSGPLGSMLARVVAGVGGAALLLAALVFLGLRGVGGWRSPRSAYLSGSRVSAPRIELRELDVTALLVPAVVAAMMIVVIVVVLLSL